MSTTHVRRSEGMLVWALPLMTAALALNACGGANPAQPVFGHGTLDLSQALPAPTPTPFPAFGARHARLDNDATPDAQSAIAPYLRAQRSPVVRTPVVRETVASTPRSQAVSVPSDRTVAVGTAGTDDARLLASRSESVASDANRYADRESRKAEGYRGGDAIVITAGALVVVLLIVLLVLLLT